MKNSTNLGDVIRNAFCSEWRITSLCGRTVAVRRMTANDRYFRNCADCKSNSKVMVIELNRFCPGGSKCDLPLVWGWCGHCDI